MVNTGVEETSVLIVGGGPAGLAAAIALGQRGIDSTVVEAREPGTDKACGEGLMPGALAALAALGIVLDPADGHPFRGIRFSDQNSSVDADFRAGTGIGMRRPELHRRLAARAAEVGAKLCWSSRVQLHRHPSASQPGVASINGREIRFGWLVGADGQASPVRRSGGLDAWRSERMRFGFRRHFQLAPWSEFVEVHWAARGQIYVTPVAADQVCVVAMSHDSRTNWDEFLPGFPELQSRLGAAAQASQPRGALSAMRRLKRVAHGRTALIGDASGSADAITGEGLAMTFQQAAALAEAIDSGSLLSYEQRHRAIGRRPHWTGGFMLNLDRRPALQRPVLGLFAAYPAIFRTLLHASAGTDHRKREDAIRGSRLWPANDGCGNIDAELATE